MKLAKTYEPNNYEPNIYAMWETSGKFTPSGQGEPYSIIMPPPNANGNLHTGHALTVALEDILTRFHRMKGRDTIYIPGADHAGFETWVVYERELAKTGKSRFDFTREQLYSQVWNFVDEQRGNMELQLRALGVSASWQHQTFTLDEKVIKTVYSTFKRLWNDGLIYRGERIVNYSTVYQTGYADIEVDHREEKGTLWNIAYPLLDEIGELVVATTRPETMLGDTAVAVHPDDERYKHLIGGRVMLPLTDREIPIIADEYVDPKYGTGVVKITPAHDPNDFEVGGRHDLEKIQVIDFNGTMINVPPQFAGITPLEARKRVLAALQAQDMLRGEQSITHVVGYDYKSGEPIQPLPKDQWFLSVRSLAERAKQAIEQGEITFSPASKKDEVIRYYDNLRDWNLSRQIPWGIPIPAFQNVNDINDWIYDERVDEKEIVVDGQTYRREEDTFDTWFSSGQWPFITTDYLDGGELARFYPTSVLETGFDILYQWIARMIMLGLYATDKVPFKHVYLHGLILDEKGQKMSKSKGNVINPMELVSEFGSDALRLGIISSRSAGQNQAFARDKVVAGRNFANKLWNIARYIQTRTGETYRPQGDLAPKSTADHWIIRQLNQAADSIEQYLTDYRFAEAAEMIYHTIWGDVADWYVEVSKQQDNIPMLAWVLDTSLKLTHPFAPFVSETIWQTLNWHDNLLMEQTWPRDNPFDEIAAAAFERVKEFVTEARFVMSELPGNKKYTIYYSNDGLIADNIAILKHLTRAKDIVEADQPRGIRLAASNREAWLGVDEDTLYEHQSALELRLAETRQRIKLLEERLANENYTRKAPEKLVEASRRELDETKALEQRFITSLSVIEH